MGVDGVAVDGALFEPVVECGHRRLRPFCCLVCFTLLRCVSNRSSAMGMLWSYQRFHRPCLSPATSMIAARCGSKANSARSSVRPALPGRGVFLLLCRVWVIVLRM